MGHYEDARMSAELSRVGMHQAKNAVGDIEHLHAIKRLLAGMDENLDYSNPANKKVINNLAQGYKNIDKAVEHHLKGDGAGSISFATLAAHHATEVGRALSPATEEEAQENYDPHVISAAAGGANLHRDDFIKTVNEGK